jgi:transposase
VPAGAAAATPRRTAGAIPRGRASPSTPALFSQDRSRCYGSLLVDLEARHPVDLLADRTATTFATWLKEHTQPAVISRDRAGAYAEGARQGAPVALQVADRFHLLSNAGDALERVLGREHVALRAAAATVDACLAPDATQASAKPLAPEPRDRRPTRAQQEQTERRARRLTRYGDVLALHQQGLSQGGISVHLGMSRKTVRRFLRADVFPERARPRRRPSMLTPYEPYLRERWTVGCHNAHTLWEEIRDQGFAGAPALVRRHVGAWRTAASAAPLTPPAPQPTPVWSPRLARWLLTKPLDTLEPTEQQYRAALLAAAPTVVTALERVEAFTAIVRTRDHTAFAAWMTETERCGVPELRSFVAGIGRDQAAVEAALLSPWSNGQTEGQINRLKTLKRQMYGRAKLDLLRQRFLAAA